MDEDEDWTPFWVEERDDRRRTDRLRHRASSIFFSSGVLVMLLMVTALFFLVFVVPSTISFTTQVFKPINVRKSWDSINVVLVLFALVFGFLSRNKNQENYNSPKNNLTRFDEMKRSNPTTPHQWYGYSPREGRRSNPSTPHEWHGYSDSGNVFGSSGGGGGGLRRTYSSYPDLRGWSNELAYNDPWRFNDDTVVETYRRSESGKLLPLQRQSFTEIDTNPAEIKNVVHMKPIVNLPTKESSLDHPPPPPEQPTLPPSPPPQPKQEAEEPPEQLKIQHKPSRTSQSGGQKLERRRKKRENELEEKNPIVEEPRTPPPPPPLPPPSYYTEQKTSKLDKKRGGASATKEFLNSLYHKKKKKKQRSKSIDNLDSLFHQSQPPATHFRLPPPSPPPPPPPPFFHLFSSKKDKKRKTEKTSPVTKPPPAPATCHPTSAVRESYSSYETGPSSIYKNSFESVNEKRIRGGTPMMHIPLPPPPPPPPPPQYYKPAWKFVVQGDYVRMDSFSSSEPSDVDSDETPTTADGDGGSPLFPPSPLFCPSPDVDTKAEGLFQDFGPG